MAILRSKEIWEMEDAVMKKCGFVNVYSGMGLYQGADREIIKNVWKM